MAGLDKMKSNKNTGTSNCWPLSFEVIELDEPSGDQGMIERKAFKTFYGFGQITPYSKLSLPHLS